LIPPFSIAMSVMIRSNQAQLGVPRTCLFRQSSEAYLLYRWQGPDQVAPYQATLDLGDARVHSTSIKARHKALKRIKADIDRTCSNVR
jgi:hypothetical protein